MVYIEPTLECVNINIILNYSVWNVCFVQKLLQLIPLFLQRHKLTEPTDKL